jgi:PAS domain S-box-containing protein
MTGTEIISGLSLLSKWLPIPRFNRKYRNFFELSNVPFIIVSKSGVILDINDALACELGYTAKELRGKKFMKFLARHDLRRTEDQMRILRDGGIVSDFTNEWIDKSGKTHFINWNAVANSYIYGVGTFIHG